MNSMNVEITNGENIIRLLNDGFTEALIIENIRALTCADCDGSIGFYYAISDRPGDEQQARTRALTDVLISGTNAEILEQIKIFLQLFANGKYSVEINEIPRQDVDFWQYDDKIEIDDEPTWKWFSGGFYPVELFNYVLTRPRTTIDPKRVAYYETLIQKGMRPKIIALGNRFSGYGPRFVLDGHHKVQAYQSLNYDYPMVEIMLEKDGFDDPEIVINAAAEILNEIELQHLLVQNRSTDLAEIGPSEQSLFTTILDSYLSTCRFVETRIVELFQKYDKANTDRELLWLSGRLRALSQNPKIGNEFIFPVKEENDYNFPKFDQQDLDRWIKNYLPNYTKAFVGEGPD